MHIQEGTNTTLTTCTKMTEEVDRRHGVNGNSSSKAVSEDAPVHNSSLNATGGRLKFFKDGKFILELVRGWSREGERAGWVSVPRKTFWPPAGAGAPPAAPPSAPLSVSDDNSSVQSSPWQRDHCWKQQAPRKNLNKELAMFYCRPSTLAHAHIAAESRARRRRPHRAAPPDARAGAASPAPAPTDDREKYYRMKLKKPYQYRKLRVYKKRRAAPRRGELERVLRKLHERLPAPPPPVNAKLAGCRQEHAMVSPRKRILRELERVSLEDGVKRRARAAPALSTASYPPPGPSAPRAPPAEPPRRDAPKHVSPYSIHSLLSMPDEGPRRSPLAAVVKAESPDSAAGAGSPGPARVWPPYRARDEWYAYGAAHAHAAAHYPYLAHVYRAPPAPLWMYAVPPAPAPSPWAPLPLPLLTDHIPKDEPTSDLPLNLSKH